jgi:hypothetical protein
LQRQKRNRCAFAPGSQTRGTLCAILVFQLLHKAIGIGEQKQNPMRYCVARDKKMKMAARPAPPKHVFASIAPFK